MFIIDPSTIQAKTLCTPGALSCFQQIIHSYHDEPGAKSPLMEEIAADLMDLNQQNVLERVIKIVNAIIATPPNPEDPAYLYICMLVNTIFQPPKNKLDISAEKENPDTPILLSGFIVKDLVLGSQSTVCAQKFSLLYKTAQSLVKQQKLTPEDSNALLEHATSLTCYGYTKIMTDMICCLNYINNPDRNKYFQNVLVKTDLLKPYQELLILHEKSPLYARIIHNAFAGTEAPGILHGAIEISSRLEDYSLFGETPLEEDPLKCLIWQNIISDLYHPSPTYDGLINCAIMPDRQRDEPNIDPAIKKGVFEPSYFLLALEKLLNEYLHSINFFSDLIKSTLLETYAQTILIRHPYNLKQFTEKLAELDLEKLYSPEEAAQLRRDFHLISSRVAAQMEHQTAQKATQALEELRDPASPDAYPLPLLVATCFIEEDARVISHVAKCRASPVFFAPPTDEDHQQPEIPRETHSF